MAAAPRVVVIGAGIVGASIAYHLARRGAAVTVLDRGQPAGEATGKSFAWINASYGHPEPYYRLRFQSMQEYRRLEHELGGTLRVDWGGCLVWDLTDTELDDFARRHGSWGYDVRLVERVEIEALEPNLIEAPPRAAFVACDGAIEPVAATEALLAAATRCGAEIRLETNVTSLVATNRRLEAVETNAGVIETDWVVVAAGVDTAGLASSMEVNLPTRSSPGLLVHCKPAERLLSRVVASPGLHMKQNFDGRIVAGKDFAGGTVPNDREAEGARLLKLIKSQLLGAAGLELERVSVGIRPIPADGLPAVGFAPSVAGLYLAVMHSGVTLAPAVGRLAAMEILDDVQVELLDPFRPARFA